MYAIERALRGVMGRWRRNALVVFAVALSAACLVTMLGISLASSDAIIESVSGGETTRVQAVLPAAAWAVEEEPLLNNSGNIEGVDAAGTLTGAEASGLKARLDSVARPEGIAVGIAVASPRGLAQRDLAILDGAISLPADPATATVLLGSRVARDLGVSARSGDNRIRINGSWVLVAAVLEESGESSALSASAVISPGALVPLGLTPVTRVVELRVQTERVGSALKYVAGSLWPADPAAVSLSAAQDPRQLRDRLEGETLGLVLAVTWVMIGVAVFLIANTMQIAIGERHREIGVERAYGVGRGSIAGQFFCEAALLGGIGAIAGLLLGAGASAAVCLINGWTILLPPLVLLVVPAGLLLGGLGGSLPAWTASRIRPIELLR